MEIYSTGGTRKHLESEGIPVRDVAEYTGFPEMMDGRLKTLHPKVHGGILCRHDNPEDMKSLAEHGILTFELVVVNLYPFEATVAEQGVTVRRGDRADRHRRADAGPRGGQEPRLHHDRHRRRASTPRFSNRSRPTAARTLELRRRLAGEAFAHTARYDRAIADYFAGADGRGAVSRRRIDAESAAARKCCATARTRTSRRPSTPSPTAAGHSVVAAQQLHGKELSYNNLLDLDSALAIVRGLREPAAVVIKHNNPCGAAVADTLADGPASGRWTAIR